MSVEACLVLEAWSETWHTVSGHTNFLALMSSASLSFDILMAMRASERDGQFSCRGNQPAPPTPTPPSPLFLAQAATTVPQPPTTDTSASLLPPPQYPGDGGHQLPGREAALAAEVALPPRSIKQPSTPCCWQLTTTATLSLSLLLSLNSRRDRCRE